MKKAGSDCFRLFRFVFWGHSGVQRVLAGGEWGKFSFAGCRATFSDPIKLRVDEKTRPCFASLDVGTMDPDSLVSGLSTPVDDSWRKGDPRGNSELSHTPGDLSRR
jgi:hypothetical protein